MAASDNILGSIGIIFTGDTSKLAADFAAAQQLAQAAGQRVAASFDQGMKSASGLVGSTDEVVAAIKRLTVVVQEESAAATLAAQRNQALAQAFGQTAQAGQNAARSVSQVGQASEHSTFSVRYLFLGLKDIAEGRYTFALAEGANQLNRFGPAALAGAAALALIGGLIFKAGENANFWGETSVKEAEKVRAAFVAAQKGIEESNDSLRVTNDKLENEIAKIEKKPENGIKLALDEAIVSADQLGKSLNADLGALGKIISGQKTGIFGQLLGEAGTGDIEDEIKKFQARVAEATSRGGIPRQETVGGVSLFSPEALQGQKQAAQIRTNTELTRLFSEEILNLQHELKDALGAPAPGIIDSTRRVEVLTGAIASLKAQAESIELKGANANLLGGKTDAQVSADADRVAREKARAAKQALTQEENVIKSANGEMFADLKADHELTKAEEIDFWQERLAEVDQFGNKYLAVHREIARTLGTLYQEQFRENDTELKKLAQRIGKDLEEVSKEVRKRQENAFITANLPAARVTLGQVKADEVNARTAGQRAAAQDELQIAQAKARYELQLVPTIAQQLAYRKDIAAIEDKKFANDIRGLENEKNIVDALETEEDRKKRIARIDEQIAVLEGRRAVAGVNAQSDIDRVRPPLRERLRGDLNQANNAVGPALGSALAKGIFDGGKGIGRDITDSLKNIGKQLFAQVFDNLVAVTIANTLATEENTIWLAIKGIFGLLADGGPASANSPYIVGERGPELFIPDHAGTVIPNNRLGGASAPLPSGGSSSTAYGDMHFHAHGVNDPDAFVDHVMRKLPARLKQRGTGRAFSN